MLQDFEEMNQINILFHSVSKKRILMGCNKTLPLNLGNVSLTVQNCLKSYLVAADKIDTS